MTIFRHELKRNMKSQIFWALSISVFIVICLLLYPKVEKNMNLMNSLLNGLSIFGAAIGWQGQKYLNMITYYGLEAGVFLGLGGGLFAATSGAVLLSKEEGRRTAEYLFSHPISRTKVFVEKLLSLVVLVVIFNVTIGIISFLVAGAVGFPFPTDQFVQYHLAQLLLTLQCGLICYAFSAFMSKDSMSVGIAVVLVFYFMNTFININQASDILMYITPYYYADSSRVIDGAIPWDFVKMHYGATAILLSLSLLYFTKKDLQN